MSLIAAAPTPFTAASPKQIVFESTIEKSLFLFVTLGGKIDIQKSLAS